MRFTQSLFAAAALVVAVIADVKITGAPMEFKAGETYEITYTSDAGDVPTTLLLRKGVSTNLQTVKTITDSATGGSFSWTVDSDFVDASDYALEIQQGDDTNYWGPIALSGGTGEEVSTTSESASSTPTSESTTDAPSSTPSSSPTPSNNGTTSGSPTRGSPSPSKPTGAPEETGAASLLASSPLALVFGAVAAMIYLN